MQQADRDPGNCHKGICRHEPAGLVDHQANLGTDSAAAGHSELYPGNFPRVLTWQRCGVPGSGAGFQFLGALKRGNMCALCSWGGQGRPSPPSRLQGLQGLNSWLLEGL